MNTKWLEVGMEIPLLFCRILYRPLARLADEVAAVV